MQLKNIFGLPYQKLKGLTKLYMHGREGIAAVEFALIAPVMILIFLGTVEVSYGISVDRKMSRTASSVADLITQEIDVISQDAVNEILSIAGNIMEPYKVVPCIVVTGISIKENDKKKREARVVWSTDNNEHATAAPTSTCIGRVLEEDDIASVARTVGELFPVPDSMKSNNDFLVATEVYMEHSPIVGVASYDRKSDGEDVAHNEALNINKSEQGIIDLEDVIYLRPRSGGEIMLGVPGAT